MKAKEFQQIVSAIVKMSGHNLVGVGYSIPASAVVEHLLTHVDVDCEDKQEIKGVENLMEELRSSWMWKVT
jgi:hypothetical protein